MSSSLAPSPGDSWKKILFRDGNISLTGRKALPKAPRHSRVALKHRDSQGDCSSVCMCKNSSFLITFKAVTEFPGRRGVLSPNCHDVPGAASKHIIQQVNGGHIHRALKSYARDSSIRSAALSWRCVLDRLSMVLRYQLYQKQCKIKKKLPETANK